MSDVESNTWADNLRNKYGIAEPVDDGFDPEMERKGRDAAVEWMGDGQ